MQSKCIEMYSSVQVANDTAYVCFTPSLVTFIVTFISSGLGCAKVYSKSIDTSSYSFASPQINFLAPWTSRTILCRFVAEFSGGV